MGRGEGEGEGGGGRGSCDHLLLLSEDVLIQILLWLPVLSLLRFKSVCKSWRAIIQSPFFINLHLATTEDSGSNSIIFLEYHENKDVEGTLPCAMNVAELNTPQKINVLVVNRAEFVLRSVAIFVLVSLCLLDHQPQARFERQPLARTMGFFTLFEVATVLVLQVLIISILGAFMASGYCNILTTDARRQMNKMLKEDFLVL